MIKELEAKDIVKIGNINKTFPCDKGQYTQFLMSKLTDQKVIMIGNVENDQLLSYAIIFDNRYPPILTSMSVYDIWSINHRETLLLADEVKKRCDRLIMVTPEDDKHSEKYMETFGCKKIANVYEWIK